MWACTLLETSATSFSTTHWAANGLRDGLVTHSMVAAPLPDVQSVVQREGERLLDATWLGDPRSRQSYALATSLATLISLFC